MKEQKIKSGATLDFKISLLLNEAEARALDALVGYGDDAFLDAFTEQFYKKLGAAYMKPYEKGLRSLFKTIKEELPSHLSRADNARKAFNGEKD